MKNAIPLSNETTGQILPKDPFQDLYTEVMDEGRRYFWRMNSHQTVELVVVFEDIEDFDRSLEAQVSIDFQTYKDILILVVWTVTDPVNPLGFPISLDRLNDQEIIEQILNQSTISIHFLTMLDEELLHIYSQTIELSDEEKAMANRMYQATCSEEENNSNEEILSMHSEELTDNQLTPLGTGYLLDYSSLLKKVGEEQAREKILSALLTAVDLVKGHPRAEVRQCSFLVWVAQRSERTSKGEDSILMEIYLTPPLDQLFDVVNDNQQAENPLSTVLLTFTEFLTTLEARPVDRGAFPLLQYHAQVVSFIEPDEELEKRLTSLRETKPDPYA
ncbi:MAG TPA: hypothetical protein VJ824_08215 [Bacillota bacterium]|nr:hypothetical protein [Bacillota bacterium]